MDLNEAVEKLVEEIIEDLLDPKTLLHKDNPESEEFADEFDNQFLIYVDGLEEGGDDHEDGNAFSRGVFAALRTKKGKELLAAAVKEAVEEILHRPLISTVPTSPLNFIGTLPISNKLEPETIQWVEQNNLTQWYESDCHRFGLVSSPSGRWCLYVRKDEAAHWPIGYTNVPSLKEGKQLAEQKKRELDHPKPWKPTLLWTTGPRFYDAEEILDHLRNGGLLFYRIAKGWTDPQNVEKKKYTLMSGMPLFGGAFQKFEFFDTLEEAQARAEELDATSSPPVKQEEPPKESKESPPCALKELPPKKLVWVDEMDPAHQNALGHRQARFIVFLTSGCRKYRILQTDGGFYKTPSLLQHYKEDGLYHCKNSFPTVAEAQKAAEKMEQEGSA